MNLGRMGREVRTRGEPVLSQMGTYWNPDTSQSPHFHLSFALISPPCLKHPVI